MASLETRIPPPLVAALVALGMWGVSQMVPASPLPVEVRAVAAGVLVLAGGVFGLPAVMAFRRAGTTVNPVAIDRASALVTTGVFRYSRNPMYVGVALWLLAWAAWLGQLVPVLGPVLFVLYVTRFQIIPEERILAARFGEDYAAYRRRVRRWL